MSHHKHDRDKDHQKDHSPEKDKKEEKKSSRKKEDKHDKHRKQHGDKPGKIKKLQQEKEDLQQKHQRALADYQNLLKRQSEEKERLTKYANEELLQELLPVFDHLKLSLLHVSEEDKDNQWVQGVQYVVKQFREVLENNGVKEIETEGKEFDPEYMEAVEGKGDMVSKEIKTGYTLNGKVIIPAKVKVEEEIGSDQEKEDESEKSEESGSEQE